MPEWCLIAALPTNSDVLPDDSPETAAAPHRRHRGAHPADAKLFAPRWLPALRLAVAELSWLLSRDYAWRSALKLVGDHHDLTERQRAAVSRAACADAQRQQRATTRLTPETVADQRLAIDGFNLIITLEAMLGGGVIVRGRDGCLRDLSGIHGSYHAVIETERAIMLAGKALATCRPQHVMWLLDQPISNSGRLAARLRAIAETHGWPWTVEVVMNPDPVLSIAPEVVVTSDAIILDRAGAWFNLTEYILAQQAPSYWLLDLADA